MLHILLLIFKVIAGIFLALLGIFLFLLLASLVVPLRYRIRGERSKEEWSVRGTVSWLFHAVCVKGSFGGGTPEYECYLFGIPLLRLKAWLDRKRSEKPKPVLQNKLESEIETAPDAEENTQTIAGSEDEKNLQNIPDAETKKNLPDSDREERPKNSKKQKASGGKFRFRGIVSRIRETIKKILNLPRKICFTIRENYGKISKWKSILQSEDVRWLKKLGISKTKAAIGHIRPRRVRGEILFGFEDPSHTGELLGVLGIIYPKLPKKLIIVPDFTEPVLEGWLEAGGRLYGIFFLLQLLQVLFDGKTIKTVKKFMHKEA